jgi:hypothetical protein
VNDYQLIDMIQREIVEYKRLTNSDPKFIYLGRETYMTIKASSELTPYRCINEDERKLFGMDIHVVDSKWHLKIA